MISISLQILDFEEKLSIFILISIYFTFLNSVKATGIIDSIIRDVTCRKQCQVSKEIDCEYSE